MSREANPIRFAINVTAPAVALGLREGWQNICEVPTWARPLDARRTLDAILFRMRSGCQWNQLPERFPDDSSVHRTFQRWVRLGLFERLWSTLVAACDELGGVDWEWQAADGAMGKARLGGISSGAIPPTVANAG